MRTKRVVTLLLAGLITAALLGLDFNISRSQSALSNQLARYTLGQDLTRS